MVKGYFILFICDYYLKLITVSLQFFFQDFFLYIDKREEMLMY